MDWGATAGLAAAAVGSIAAAASAVYAGLQIRESRRSATREASLEFLREIEERVVALSAVKPADARAEILSYHRGEVDELGDDARRYSAYLSALDRMELALASGALDPDIVRPWLRGLLQPKVQLMTFIEQLQAACHDTSVLEYLQRDLRGRLQELQRRTNK